MTIKKKIALSNIFMVVLPILVTWFGILLCLHTSLGSYWHTLISMYEDENGVQFAQSLMYNYQQELWNINWEQMHASNSTTEIPQNEEMTRLGNALEELGYRFEITKNGHTIYSNLSRQDVSIGRELVGQAMNDTKTLTASRYDVSVIKNTFWHGDHVFCITAIHPRKTDGQAVNVMQQYVLRYFIGFILLFVGVSMLANGLVSWWISKSILYPLNILSQGSKRIQEGQLDASIEYEKKDEFGKVCQDFEQMRLYLQESVQQRLEDEKRRKQLIAGISHDLRTPLTSISGYLDGLLEGIANTPQKQLRYLKAMQARTKTMVELLDSLSDYTRLGRDFHYDRQKVDLAQWIDDYVAGKQEENDNQNVEMIVQKPRDTVFVSIDSKEFQRVLDNLWSNTLKYREKDSCRILLRIRLMAYTNKVELVFQDDGPGVPKESLAHLFDSFYRVDDARKKSEEGSGIGLAVVQEIVEGHGGQVRAENRDGLAVILCLPLEGENDGESIDH